ncbi:hypothetical protein BJ165DRAFT_1410871 [Panaeolus papilionaceus]|nr:hypothetical protein BJ165DRAFT_1410871 [Panaeolus papilionaceus]
MKRRDCPEPHPTQARTLTSTSAHRNRNTMSYVFHGVPKPPAGYLKTPPIVNMDESKGPIVCSRVYAIPVLSYEINHFVKKYFSEDMEGYHNLYDIFTRNFPGRPVETSRIARVLMPIPDKNYEYKLKGRVLKVLAVVIGINLNEEDRKKAEDVELVKKIQEMLEVETQPAWYYYDVPGK